jgi:hypothetical protein
MIIIFFLYLFSFCYLKGIHWSLRVICSLHKFTIIFKDLCPVASCRLNINVQPLRNGHSGFCFPAGWYFIIVCMSLDVTIVLTCRIHILLQLLICTKTLCFSFHNIFTSFVVKVCVFYGFPKCFCLCCCDSGFAFFF